MRRWLLVCVALGLSAWAAFAWLQPPPEAGTHEPMDEESRRELRQIIRDEPEP